VSIFFVSILFVSILFVSILFVSILLRIGAMSAFTINVSSKIILNGHFSRKSNHPPTLHTTE
jgi:hypothetical protein